MAASPTRAGAALRLARRLGRGARVVTLRVDPGLTSLAGEVHG